VERGAGLEEGEFGAALTAVGIEFLAEDLVAVLLHVPHETHETHELVVVPKVYLDQKLTNAKGLEHALGQRWSQSDELAALDIELQNIDAAMTQGLRDGGKILHITLLAVESKIPPGLGII